MTSQDFTKPAVNDENGQCLSCGRDNHGYEGQPCADDCPMYWEEIGIAHPDHAVAA
jgi:hypothetical protein